MLTLDKIYHAAFVLKDVIRKTDLINAPALNPNADIYLKTENLQITGSFKLRGASYKISQLTEEEKAAGIVASSAGNHAQGVAMASAKSGIPCTICMPDAAPISKIEATKRLGAKVALVPGAYDDAYKHALKLQKENSLTLIHPFDDPDVIAGQGTIGLELLDQLPDMDAVIVPIGGGGLISGVAFAIKSLNPNIKVYGVQANGAPSMRNSIEHHQIETLESVSTIADGIAVKRPGELTYELCEKYVDDICTVTDDEVSTAILALIERQKMIAEGAGAVAVAAAMFNKFDIKGKKVACIVSGGNIDVNILSRVISRGLLKSGRSTEITLEVIDKPGQLSDVSRIISDVGGNVVSVHYDQTGENTHVNGCYLRLRLETRDFEQIDAIRQALQAGGYKIVSSR